MKTAVKACKAVPATPAVQHHAAEPDGEPQMAARPKNRVRPGGRGRGASKRSAVSLFRLWIESGGVDSACAFTKLLSA
ncbi:hypothetical protein E2C01_047635 [Portunus trituberculatus]|uniref:Uncharacterized protein n=1 Tax=Portunus trituberculatus TaxID=210409 RepID=A0A5B7G846_PORTR|nr:hypothetical protein [Portunus trituberculatus]